MKKRHAIIIVIFFLLLLGIAGGIVYVFWDIINPWETTPDYVLFKYEVRGIYGANATYVNSSWTFTPIYKSSFWTSELSDTVTGFRVDIDIREPYCVISQSFWLWANTTVSYMNATLISNGTEVFFIDQHNNPELTFDFGVFSTDLHILVFVDTLSQVNLKTEEGKIKW